MRSRRDRLFLAIVGNLLATPGLGSWAAGHRIAGAGQLITVCSGFALFLVHFARLMRTTWDAALDGLNAPPLSSDLLHLSLGIMGVAWLWSAITSVQIYLTIRRLAHDEAQALANPPPRLG